MRKLLFLLFGFSLVFNVSIFSAEQQPQARNHQVRIEQSRTEALVILFLIGVYLEYGPNFFDLNVSTRRLLQVPLIVGMSDIFRREGVREAQMLVLLCSALKLIAGVGSLCNNK
ncbi:MAG: hypothetical protein P4L22_00360 [Candidatus Babeliales bacterium]|nr:hypothetical protein [Candidatus Babeliales bacterium]